MERGDYYEHTDGRFLVCSDGQSVPPKFLFVNDEHDAAHKLGKSVVGWPSDADSRAEDMTLLRNLLTLGTSTPDPRLDAALQPGVQFIYKLNGVSVKYSIHGRAGNRINGLDENSNMFAKDICHLIAINVQLIPNNVPAGATVLPTAPVGVAVDDATDDDDWDDDDDLDWDDDDD